MIPTPAGRDTRPEYVWLFNFGTNDYSNAKETSQRLVSFRAQYKLMIENNVPKEAKYLLPGRENWFYAVAAALKLEAHHIKDAALAAAEQRRKDAEQPDFIIHQPTYKALAQYLRNRFETLREAMLHEFLAKNQEYDSDSESEDEDCNKFVLASDAATKYQQVMLLLLSSELATGTRDFFLELLKQAETSGSAADVSKVTPLWDSFAGERISVHTVAKRVFDVMNHELLIQTLQKCENTKIPDGWIPQLLAYNQQRQSSDLED